MYTNVGDLLMRKGDSFYRWGKTGFGSFFSGLVLAVMICIISIAGYGRVYFFDGFAITAVLWICVFVLVAGGSAMIPLYFLGLHYMGLGRLNQYGEILCQNMDHRGKYSSHELPDL